MWITPTCIGELWGAILNAILLKQWLSAQKIRVFQGWLWRSNPHEAKVLLCAIEKWWEEVIIHTCNFFSIASSAALLAASNYLNTWANCNLKWYQRWLYCRCKEVHAFCNIRLWVDFDSTASFICKHIHFTS